MLYKTIKKIPIISIVLLIHYFIISNFINNHRLFNLENRFNNCLINYILISKNNSHISNSIININSISKNLNSKKQNIPTRREIFNLLRSVR